MHYRTVVIDSCDVYANVLKDVLKKFSEFKIIKFSERQQVLDQVHAFVPEIILIEDSIIREDNGQILSDFNKNTDLKKIPVIIYANQQFFGTIMTYAVADIIRLPSTEEEFIYRIENAIKKRRIQHELEKQHKKLSYMLQKNKRKTINLFGKHIDLKKAKKEIDKQKREISLQNERLQATFLKNKKKTIELFGKHIDLKKAQKEIAHKNAQIEAQNKAITDSIKYARFIQESVLPRSEKMKEIFPDYFTLYMPKDIVSGDFYWVYKKGRKKYLVVADCTGHGVPGAFMSMMGISLLNEIVTQKEEKTSADILNELREKVVSSLQQTGRFDEAADGMDIALCIFDQNSNELQFAGAHNPLYIIRNGTLIETKGDRMPIGFSLRINKNFTHQTIGIYPGDLLYLFSDGYPDQFGGESGMKLRLKQFQNILLEIHHKPLHEQKEILFQRHIEWKGKYDQIDDICIVGIKI